MMEYREAPRTVMAEGLPRDAVAAPASPRRFATVRRLARTRLVLALLAVLVTLGLLGSAGAHAVRAMVAWLHEQPPYQLDFREIRLDPPPPAWYRGGTEAFLNRVRDGAGRPGTLAVLDLDLDGLASDF